MTLRKLIRKKVSKFPAIQVAGRFMKKKVSHFNCRILMAVTILVLFYTRKGKRRTDFIPNNSKSLRESEVNLSSKCQE